MDVNACTGHGEAGRLGCEHCDMLGAYGRDTPSDNGEHLLAFASNHYLAPVSMFSITPKTDIPQTFNGVVNKKHVDNILARQRDSAGRYCATSIVVSPHLGP